MPALKNSKHESVLAHYIRDSERVGWRAYQAVYAQSSQRAAEVAWSRLLTNAEFTARHDELLAEVTEAAKTAAVMDLTEVLEELSKLGRSNLQNIVVSGDDTADVVQALRDMAPEHAAAIKTLITETYVEGHGEDKRTVKRVKLELHDKKGALAELRRHYEPERHEHSGKDGGPIKTEVTGEGLSELELARRIAFALELGARKAAKAPAEASAKRKSERTARAGKKRATSELAR